jgi:L-lactate dehydrogenase complex protein LldG
MLEITSRETVLKKIRQALIHKTSQKFPGVDFEKNIYNTSGSIDQQFISAFTKVGGQFFACENELEFLEKVIDLSQQNKWRHFYCREKNLIRIMDQVDFPYTLDDRNYPEGMVAITTCEALVSRLGSIVVSSMQGSGRRLFVVPTVHIVMAYASQLVPEMKDALQLIKNKYGDHIPSMIAGITGPSRTADIEKTLVTPAHGPRDIFVFLIDD